jgi:oligopeptide/dipeptide ABC transporter ATP-binding protein
METLLSVQDLCVEFDTDDRPVRAVDHVNFDVGKGERVGLVGESGSGKSVTARAIMGLIRKPGRVAAGTVRFHAHDLLRASESEMNDIRGRRIALIPQDASLALNPVLSVGEQMREILARHLRLRPSDAGAKCADTLRRMGLADPDRVMRSYANELSGGMKQRVGIAMALLCDPELLIADDPTSAVDVTIQAQILSEFRDLTQRLGLSVLFITHDLRVVSTLCSRVVVLYAGQVAEVANPEGILRQARHPYTAALVRCSPNVKLRVNPLPMVPGATPDSLHNLTGCRFHPRCSRAVQRCPQEAPPLDGNHHRFACWNPRP